MVTNLKISKNACAMNRLLWTWNNAILRAVYHLKTGYQRSNCPHRPNIRLSGRCISFGRIWNI
jgi:hypothetical protein